MAKKKDLSKYIPEVAKEKERKNRGKKGKKHDPSSEEKKERSHKFFNKTNHNNIRKTLPKILNEIADRYDVAQIDLKNSVPYPDDFFARDWSWRASFFIKNLEEYENLVDYTVVDHYRWWLDQLINQCSVMIWNLAHKTMKDDYKKTNIVPANPQYSQ